MELPSAYRLPELIQKPVWRGLGQQEALQLLIHDDEEIAMLFNCSSLKKHAGLAFSFVRESKDTIVDFILPQKEFISGFYRF